MNISGLVHKVYHDVVTTYQFAHVVRYAQNLVLSVLLVKSGISLEEIGVFEMILFTITMVSQFWISGIRDAMVTAYEKSDQKQKVLSLGFCISLFLAVITSGIMFLFQDSMFYFQKPALPEDVILIACCYLIGLSLANLPETILLLTKKSKILFWYTTLFILVYVLIIGYTLWFFPDIMVLLKALLIFSVLKMFCAVFLTFRKEWHINIMESVQFLKYSLPFFLIALTGLAMDLTDGLFVKYFFGPETFAIYKYGAREFPLSSLLIHSLSVAMIPLISEAKDLPVLKQKANKHMHLLFPVSILLIWLSKPVFIFMYHEDFAQSALIFNIYLLILGSRLLMPHTFLLAQGKQKWVFWIGIFEIFCNIFLSLWWVQTIGLEGLIWATVVAYYLHKCLMLVVIHRHFQIRLYDLIDVSWWIFYQILALVSFFLSKIWL